jgi:hypothetical protein
MANLHGKSSVLGLFRAHTQTPQFMPIRRFLGGHKFDGETIRLMGIAFEMALASLHATPVCDDLIRAVLAQRIARAKHKP